MYILVYKLVSKSSIKVWPLAKGKIRFMEGVVCYSNILWRDKTIDSIKIVNRCIYLFTIDANEIMYLG